MWLSNITQKFMSILIIGHCNIVIVKSVNPVSSIIGGITNVASSATNFLSGAVDKPKNLIINATRVTTDLIDSAASVGLEFKFRRFLEKFRKQMPYGMENFGIPVLEPLTIEELCYEIDNPEIGKLQLWAEDVEIENLSAFLIERTRISLIGPTVTLNIVFPTVYAHGYYNVSGTLGDMFSLCGSGPFHALLYNLRIYVYTVLGYSGRMYVKDFDLDFTLDSIDLEAENLMGNESVSKVLNEVIRQLAPEAIEVIKPEILPGIRDYMGSKLNETIYHLTVRDVREFITIIP